MILGIDVGQKHLGVAIWDGTRIQQWAVWDTQGSSARDLWTCLDLHATPDFLNGVQHVVIERQPSKNPTMTRIMHYLEFFFAGKALNTSLQDAKRKLIYAATTAWFPDDAINKEWTYCQRKKLAVRTIRNYLDATPQDLASIFDNASKKDDLADAALIAMAHEQQVNGQNVAPKRLVACKPTERQRRLGKLSRSNVKYLLTRATQVSQTLKDDPQLARALKKHFGTYDDFIREISG